MTNNTLNNVPRELLERCAQYTPTLEKQEDRARALSELRALLSAPSPAGVDGLEVVAKMSRAGDDEIVFVSVGDPYVIDGTDLCRLSDAQAIIDGLRGEVVAAEGKWRLFDESLTASVDNEVKLHSRLSAAIDQRDQLANILREASQELSGYIKADYPAPMLEYPHNQRKLELDMGTVNRIDSALAELSK